MESLLFRCCPRKAVSNLGSILHDNPCDAAGTLVYNGAPIAWAPEAFLTKWVYLSCRLQWVHERRPLISEGAFMRNILVLGCSVVGFAALHLDRGEWLYILLNTL